jgi:hypothetical protein
MLGQKHQIASRQSDFYRDKFRKILRWLIGSLIVMYVLIFAIFYLIFVEPPQKYFGNTTDGKILPMPGVRNG